MRNREAVLGTCCAVGLLILSGGVFASERERTAAEIEAEAQRLAAPFLTSFSQEGIKARADKATGALPKIDFYTEVNQASSTCDSSLGVRTKDFELEDELANAIVKQRCIVLKMGAMSLFAAQNGSPAEALAVKQAADQIVKAQSEEVEEKKSATDFMGLTWGLGFGVSFSGDDNITAAEVVDGKLVVTEEKKQLPRAVLEFHNYLWHKKAAFGLTGWGPFVAVTGTKDDVLEGVGFGGMWGVKGADADNTGFSIGVGAILDAGVKDLADGFNEGEALPEGQTAARFEEKSRWSGIVFVTRTF